MNRGGALASAARSGVFGIGVNELFTILRVESAPGRGTISANIICGFGSPAGAVSTQREIRCLGMPAWGPETMVSSRPPGGNKTCSATRVRWLGSCSAMGIPSVATISNVWPSTCRSRYRSAEAFTRRQDCRSPGAISICGRTDRSPSWSRWACLVCPERSTTKTKARTLPALG